MRPEELIQLAREGLKQAYVPYSGFPVGAAVLTESGQVYTGCNIENASYGLTSCAERTAIFKAVSSGEKRIRMIAVVGNTEDPITPCGACRQVMAEFGPDMQVILAGRTDAYKAYALKELLPEMFILNQKDSTL